MSEKHSCVTNESTIENVDRKRFHLSLDLFSLKQAKRRGSLINTNATELILTNHRANKLIQTHPVIQSSEERKLESFKKDIITWLFW